MVHSKRLKIENAETLRIPDRCIVRQLAVTSTKRARVVSWHLGASAWPQVTKYIMAMTTNITVTMMRISTDSIPICLLCNHHIDRSKGNRFKRAHMAGVVIKDGQ